MDEAPQTSHRGSYLLPPALPAKGLFIRPDVMARGWPGFLSLMGSCLTSQLDLAALDSPGKRLVHWGAFGH